MARVTVEDCIDKVPNRFDLVLLAAQRARAISGGAELTIDRDRDKNPVVALREIADETVLPEELKADLVLLAMGFTGPRRSGLVECAGVELDPRGNVQANVTDYATSAPNVFSCGDMRRGQSLVVWAIREGRQCARAVDEYLMGVSKLPR